jgi:DNA-binding transcriptional LysR family regulator
MDRFEAMSMVLTAVDGGRLSAAAREMRVPISTLSRKVADLDAFLGTKLLICTTRNLTLTDAASPMSQRCDEFWKTWRSREGRCR